MRRLSDLELATNLFQALGIPYGSHKRMGWSFFPDEEEIPKNWQMIVGLGNTFLLFDSGGSFQGVVQNDNSPLGASSLEASPTIPQSDENFSFIPAETTPHLSPHSQLQQFIDIVTRFLVNLAKQPPSSSSPGRAEARGRMRAHLDAIAYHVGELHRCAEKADKTASAEVSVP